MQAIPARPGLLDQVRPDEQVQHRAGLPGGGAGERGDRVTVEVGAGLQAQQPERQGRHRVQVLVRPREHCPHPGSRISVSSQQVKPPPLVRQLTNQVGQGHAGTRSGEFGGHAQRQRQP